MTRNATFVLSVLGLGLAGMVGMVASSVAKDPDGTNILDASIAKDIADEEGSPIVVKRFRRCGTTAPDKQNRNVMRLRMASVRVANANVMRAAGPVTVPVYFHVIHKGNVGIVTDDQINRQIDVLNDNYMPHGFKFTLQGISRTDVLDPSINRPEWFTIGVKSVAELDAKSTLGVNPAQNLNLYTAEPSDPQLGGLLGFATFPWDLAGDPKRDGVVVLHTSLPGGQAPFNQGKTAIHEVGHWLGLFHTFQDGCTQPGDEVSDTPAQSDGDNIFECDDSLDTCEMNSGKDPVHNYMSYATDECLSEFTLGQRDRMQLQVATFRPLLLNSSVRSNLRLIGSIEPAAAQPPTPIAAP